MKARLCRFLGSSAALYTLGALMASIVGPAEWWWKLILVFVATPIVLLATTRFYGNHQIWNPPCGQTRKNRPHAD